MSDALKYLMQIRPREMEDYFSFLKNSGRHLDDKTKAIISVITKVDKQTETGFRQYLKRALAHGVTANQIIDALFVAFPTLGLSKIIWAIDILLEMDMAEFEPEIMREGPNWHELIQEEKLMTGVSMIKDADGKELIVYRENEDIRVYDNRCPHRSTPITKNDLSGLELTCPLHKWKFDLRTGECLEVGDKPLNMLECKIENGLLKAYW
jgi:nitrite reductase/ring-hydroxylating ferredoxin subunit/alkylhydroperoxidase/carboxymuconolactone decarboxylase family protein YurZ